MRRCKKCNRILEENEKKYCPHCKKERIEEGTKITFWGLVCLGVEELIRTKILPKFKKK